MNLIQQRMNDILENPYLLKYYAKPKCRQCNGKGSLDISLSDEFGKWHNQKTICNCVKRAIAKEVNDG